MKNKAIKLAIASTFMIPTVAVSTTNQADAATYNQVSDAVQKAISTSQVLRRACSIEWTGDGKTRPYKEYNAAKTAYNEAIKLVNQLRSDQKQVFLAKLDDPQLQIKRAAYYIDAITAGKKIEEKKLFLESQLKEGVLSDKTVTAYHELSYEIKKQTKLLDRVYGVTTREAIRYSFKETAEKLRDDLSYPMTVRMALSEINRLPSGETSKLLSQGKKALMFLEVIPQKEYYDQLRLKWDKLQSKIPEDVRDNEFDRLLEVNNSLRELRQLVKPGVSDSKVPSLVDTISSSITQVSNSLYQEKVETRLDSILSQLQVPISEIKGMLTQKAVEAGIPPELVKSIVITENGSFQQFDSKGEVFKSPDNGYGIMQVTPLDEHDTRYNWDQVKYDLEYNIEIGIKILQEKWSYSGTRIPVINNGEKEILENWYFAVMAYNGLSKVNDPNHSDRTYQSKVYNNMAQYAQVSPEILNKDNLKISYSPTTGQAIFSEKMNYATKEMTKSTQLYSKGDTVILPSKARLRDKPSTTGGPVDIAAGTKVDILSGPIEDENKYNLFVWYKVKNLSTGQEGYIASVSL
ncbi:transglycosylase SLT domain-containing protein [Cytobacillus sp. FJAT-54145]|uniref:Transglycosylase SLT domain-containing protein n=1 Tax=Cytobacillus spartinae TaxID=3299023 RepID=A0ABW6KFU6_9BACI